MELVIRIKFPDDIDLGTLTQYLDAFSYMFFNPGIVDIELKLGVIELSTTHDNIVTLKRFKALSREVG